MNDSMLMQATCRRRELTREVGQARLAAELRRSRLTSRPAQAMTQSNTGKKAPTEMNQKAGGTR
jgi:hypothetical protein